MDERTFAQGYALLTLHYPQDRNVPDDQRGLLMESWWGFVASWRGDVWLESVDWWIGRQQFMPKVAELTEAYEALLLDRRRTEERALPPPAVEAPPPLTEEKKANMGREIRESAFWRDRLQRKTGPLSAAEWGAVQYAYSVPEIEAMGRSVPAELLGATIRAAEDSTTVTQEG